MSELLAQSLFYPQDLAARELEGLVLGVVEVLPGFDVLDFAAEAGGDAERAMAVPLVAGMDEIDVQRALIRLRARTAEREITSFTVSEGSGDDKGVILVLPSTLRLLDVELEYSTLPPPVGAASEPAAFLTGKTDSTSPDDLRLVLRPAVNAGPPFEFGPPVFAAPHFPAPGKMYGPILGGLTVRDLDGQRFMASIGGVRGSAWLLQLARGAKPEDLVSLAFSATVNKVVIDAAASNLSVTLAAAEGEIPLWAHPEPLHPEAGEQEIDFTPLAQRHLQTALEAAGPEPTDPTLGLPLRFHSDSAGALEVTAKTLAARYRVRPLGAEPTTLELGGSWTDLELEAPAGRRPGASSGRLVAKHLGRELNDPTAVPPPRTPEHGLRVDAERWAAAAVTVQPLPGGAGQPVPIVAARLLLSSTEDAEAVVQPYSDAAGAPGAPLGGPLVRQLEAGFSGWLEFPLDSPLELDSPGEPLWLAVRSNRGEVRWFTGESGEPARISLDRGETWAVAEGPLRAAREPLAQLFHVAPEPLRAPAIEVWAGEQRMTTNLLAGASAASPPEFSRDPLSLPAAILDQLAATTGAGRARLALRLFSPAVVELTFTDLLLSYDPYQTGAGG